MATRVGKLTKVMKSNKKTNGTLNYHYHSTWVKYKGRTIPVLFTDDQIDVAFKRAVKNSDIVVGRSVSSLILD